MQETNQEKKVVLRFSHIGDIILLSQVLFWRYKEFGETFILITQKGMAGIFTNNPAVCEVVELDKQELKGFKLLATAKEIAKKYPYPLFDLHKTLRSKIFKLFWAKQKYTYEKDSFARRLFLLTKGKIRSNRLSLHVVSRYAEIFAKVYDVNNKTVTKIPSQEELMPQFFLEECEKQKALEFLQERNVENKKIIAIHPFATHQGKVWKEENFKELYQALLNDYFPIVIGVKPKNTKLDWLDEKHSALDIFSLRESAALLSYADCIVTGDSAPLHLAMSVKTKVIALFGATSKEWGFFPLGKNDVFLQNPMPCAPCSLHGKKDNCPHYYACINKITVQDVLNKI